MRLFEILRTGLVALLVASPALAQQLAGSPPVWTGSVRCDIEIKGTDYANHQTHIWTLTGVTPANGSALDYPATWSVTGEGFQQATPNSRAGAWKTQGSAPGVRMAIFTRQSDQRLVVLLRHSLLNAPNGTTGAISAPVYEFRPFPAITDAATSTHITGSSVTPITERLNPPQPLGSQGQAECKWDLVQGGGGAAAPVAPAAGALSSAGGGAVGGGAVGTIAGRLDAAVAPRVGSAASAPAAAVPAAAGCDADIPQVACQLPQMRNGVAASASANFHVASDTSDWFTVTAIVNPTDPSYAILDLSLTGGTADGSYSIDVSQGQGAPPALTPVVSSGAAHAPQTSVVWTKSSASSRTLFIQVRHVAGAPANDLYTLKLSMRGSDTAPTTVSTLDPGLLSPPLRSGGQTGTIAEAPRATEATRASASSGAAPPPPPHADGMPSTCASASGKTVSVIPGTFATVTGAIDAEGSADWLVVKSAAGLSLRVTISNMAASADASDFQVQAFSNCSSLIVMTTGTVKTLDVPDPGAHEIILKIVANSWKAATSNYSLKLEAR